MSYFKFMKPRDVVNKLMFCSIVLLSLSVQANDPSEFLYASFECGGLTPELNARLLPLRKGRILLDLTKIKNDSEVVKNGRIEIVDNENKITNEFNIFFESSYIIADPEGTNSCRLGVAKGTILVRSGENGDLGLGPYYFHFQQYSFCNSGGSQVTFGFEGILPWYKCKLTTLL